MCSKLIYTLTYDNGSSVQAGDILAAKDSVTMKVMLTYTEFNNASLLPTEDVSISNLGITITYTQSGSALVQDNGETSDYRVYHQGDKITLNNEYYYVIANSGADQDYVVALKENPLTYSEMNDYKGDASFTVYNVNGYGITPFGSSDEYAISYVKEIVETWASDKFVNNELKTVDGYRARLIMKTEYETISSEYAWRYLYLRRNWTMSKVGGYGNVYVVQTNGSINTAHYSGDGSNAPLVRPVINVYKSALETS